MATLTKAFDNFFEISKLNKQPLLEEKNLFSFGSTDIFLDGISDFLPDLGEDEKVKHIFYRSKNIFEIGILLKKQINEQYSVENLFTFSRLYKIEDGDCLSLPKFRYSEYLTASAEKYLHKFNLSFLDEERKMTAVIMKLNSDYSVIYITGQANPWLKLRIENFRKKLLNGIL